MNKFSEKTLDASTLSPAVKFQTIMDTFNSLGAGESFILQNNFDPQPLYLQLSSTNPDGLIWEYIENGPDLFRIRIGKPGEN